MHHEFKVRSNYREDPKRSTIERLVKKFQETSSVLRQQEKHSQQKQQEKHSQLKQVREDT
jgi:hypothetical protein